MPQAGSLAVSFFAGAGMHHLLAVAVEWMSHLDRMEGGASAEGVVRHELCVCSSRQAFAM
jgi:hypothetical protein